MESQVETFYSHGQFGLGVNSTMAFLETSLLYDHIQQAANSFTNSAHLVQETPNCFIRVSTKFGACQVR
jgi:hypothetical protein